MRNIRKKEDIGIYALAAKGYDRNSRKSRLTEVQNYANEVALYVNKGAEDKGSMQDI